MVKTKSTKRALLTSALSLLLCVSMLIGTTFAWFTDSVTSGRNTIQSGNLDVVLEYKTSTSANWAPVTENTKIFKDGALYEPGYTEVVFLRVSNAGSLSLKYNLKVDVLGETTSTNVAGESFSLTDYLEVGTYQMDESLGQYLLKPMFGTREAALKNIPTAKLSDYNGIVCKDAPLLAGEDSASLVAVVLTMPTTVGNEANHKTGVAAPTIDLGVTLVATQYTAAEEKDSFDNNYDKDATYPAFVSNLNELKAAINSGATVIDAAGANLGDFYYDAKFTDGVTVKNAKFTYFYGGNVEGTVVFENCEFVSDHSYSANFDSGNGNIIFNNCLFDGWSSFGTAIQGVEMNNCTFKKSYNYGVLRFYQDAVLNNCTFESSFEGIDSGEVIGQTIELNNCTGFDGKIYNNTSGATVYEANWYVDGVKLTTVPTW